MPVDSYRPLRIAFGVTAVFWLWALRPFLGLFYGADGLCPPEHFAFPAPVVTLIWWAALTSSLLMTSGFFYRPSAIVQFLCLAFFFRTPCRPDNYGDQIFVSVAFLMMFCPAPGPSPGVWLPLRAVASAVPREAAWLHKTLRLYAGTLYLVPLLYRLGGGQWWDGTAAWTALADPSTSRVWNALSRDPWGVPTWVFYGLTYGSIAYEGLFPFLVWVRRVRPYVVAAGLVFHAGMGILLDLGLFPLQMAVVLIGCLTWPSSERPADRASPAPRPRA